MPKFSAACPSEPVGPFTFWAAQPVIDGEACRCREIGHADWTHADADETHGNSTESWQVGSAAAFSTQDYVRGLVLNYLLTDAQALTRQACAVGGRRGWWFDDWREDGFRLGSRLWTLQWERSTQETLVKAREYTREALQPLINHKIADSVDVVAEYVGGGTMRIMVTVTGPWGVSEIAFRGSERPPYGFLWREE